MRIEKALDQPPNEPMQQIKRIRHYSDFPKLYKLKHMRCKRVHVCACVYGCIRAELDDWVTTKVARQIFRIVRAARQQPRFQTL